jgi:predicted alpha/beta-hydrolase family hydrolase
MSTPQTIPKRLPNPQDHALIGESAKLPINDATSVISMSPVVLPAPDRIMDLHMRVSAPATGSNIPIILLSHGQGPSNNLSSLNGYAPIADFWAAHGFAVIQPTHLSSRALSLSPDEYPEAPWFLRSRVVDFKLILDELDQIETLFPQIQGRLDHTRIAVVGHSGGGHTASRLMGARGNDPTHHETYEDLFEPRIKAGILLASPGDGQGGEGLGPAAANTDLKYHSHAEMKTPTLTVIGDSDGFPFLTTRGPMYHADGYYFSKGPGSLLTVKGGKHGLGGVSGYDTAEAADDESPERLAMVQRMTWAYLRSALYPNYSAWSAASAALDGLPGLGYVEDKLPSQYQAS